jgi:hypothetical protein
MPDQPQPQPMTIVGLRHLARLRSGRFIRIDHVASAHVAPDGYGDDHTLHVSFTHGNYITLHGQEKDDVIDLLAMHAGLQPAGPAIAVPDKTIIQP